MLVSGLPAAVDIGSFQILNLWSRCHRLAHPVIAIELPPLDYKFRLLTLNLGYFVTRVEG